MPSIDLPGKPIAITGASSGIGRATALRCAEAGMPVALFARREDRLRELGREIESRGGRAVCVPGDACSPEDNARLIDEAERAFGPVYSVFANAGYGVECAMHEMPHDDLRDIFEVNFFGTIHAIRPAVPRLLERGAGHILICSSCVSKISLPFYGAYAATKAAQHHVGRAMRLELEPHGVHVSTVHPIGTRTEFFDEARRRSGASLLIRHAPDLFMQDADTVARAVVRCLRRPRAEVWTSLAVRVGSSLAGLSPSLTDFFVRGHVRQRSAARSGGDAPGPVRSGAGPISAPEAAGS